MTSTQTDYSALLKNALVELQTLRARLKTREEPIAIIGMGCRFPNAADPEAFWQLLQAGAVAVRETPAERWDVAAFYDPDPETPGKSYLRYGSFLDKIDLFDADFFGISPREAIKLDPQQRLLLEVSWEALENTGIAPDRLMDSRTGVYMGMMYHEYAHHRLPELDPADMDGYMASGNSDSFVAGRLSYLLGLTGPSMMVATACSSSLVTVHLACQALRAGECDLALAGGVNLILSPYTNVALSKMQAVAPDGRSKTFDATADGYGRGDGCGVVVLKRLSAAQADGDHILAVIRGSAIGHNGASGGLTVPSGAAQEQLIRQAMQAAKIEPGELDFVETHGTGTSLGDPIEIRALARAIGERSQPLLVGAVKSNIGHTEAAAGVAGLIKLVLSLQYQALPPQPPLTALNPHIPWNDLPIQVNTTLTPWSRNGKPRVAGVSSFGLSGINAHLIVAEAPTSDQATKQPSDQATPQPYHLLALSAKSQGALQALAGRYAEFLSQWSEVAWADVCYTANIGRAQFDQRLTIMASSGIEAQKLLAEAAAGNRVPGVAYGAAPTAPKIAFLFTGQGAQYPDMGRQLYETQPIFRQAIDRCDEILRPLLGESLLTLLYPGKLETKRSRDQETKRPHDHTTTQPRDLAMTDQSKIQHLKSKIDETAYTQPALFALEYALAELWKSWGVTPDVVMGHSVGEVVAACVAGVFSLEDGLKLIAARGRLMQSLPQNGDMVAVLTDEARVQAALRGVDGVSIAAFNGPQNIVISGERQAVQEIINQLKQSGVETRSLTVSHAFHSPLMAPILSQFNQIAREICYSPPQIKIISNLTGKVAAPDLMTNADYWTRHIRQPVRFAEGMATLHQQGYSHFVEIGPKPVLLGMGKPCLDKERERGGDKEIRRQGDKEMSSPLPLSPSPCLLLPSLRQGQPDWQVILTTLGELYTQGVAVDWVRFYQAEAKVRQRLTLPTYPFQRQRYWLETPAKNNNRHTNGVTTLSNRETLDQLAQRLLDSGELNEAEGKLLPKLLAHLTKQTATSKSDVVFDYYNALTQSTAESGQAELNLDNETTFLTFGPLPKIVPGFAWLLTLSDREKYAEHYQISRNAQIEMRKLLFRHIDFDVCSDVLDFGCGYGSDLLRLAQQYPHLKLTGYTISSEQAQVGNKKAVRYQWQDRMQIYHRDSAADAFPTKYDLAFGFEVAHHIKDKAALFANLQQHLKPQGRLVLADFISNADFAIEHQETSSYFITKAEWVNLLAQHQLQLIDGIDISQEAANYLHDPEFTEHLAEIEQDAANGLDPNIKAALQSYNQLGKLFRKGLASYVLLTAQKRSDLTQKELALHNQAKLESMASYSESVPQQWLYQVGWRVQPRKATPAQTAEGPWLIFADGSKVGQMLAERLQQSNIQGILVSPGKSFSQVAANHWCIRPGQADDFRQLLIALDQPYRQVVYLWGLDAPALADYLEGSQLLNSTLQSCGDLLHLVQALAQSPESPRLCLVTRGAVAVGQGDDGPLHPAQAPLWGLGNVIALEHPEWQCTRLDLDLVRSADEIKALADELLTLDSETQIAWREGVRHVARLIHVEPQSPNLSIPPQLDGNASYLITGGLGALGLQVAEQLIAWGARHLVLTGRSGAQGKAREIEALAPRGATVQVIAADIAQAADAERLFAQLATLPPLRGVIHAAGVLDDGILMQQSFDRFQKVMAPKVAGSWHLHQQTAHLPLDFFVTFSSLASLIGSPGQGNYAAANAFQDALCQWRQQQGLPALSINWGLWAGAKGRLGMAGRLNTQEQERFAAQGLGMIDPAQGMELFGQLLQQGTPQIGVAPLNWDRFATPPLPFFAECRAGADQNGAGQPSALQTQLAATAPPERAGVLTSYLQAEVAKVLGRVQPPAPYQGFADMGMDSLMSVELRNRLQTALGVPLSATVIFKYPTIQDLVDYLNVEMFPDESVSEATDGADSAWEMPNATVLDGEEMDASIEDELAKLAALLGA